MDDVIELAYTTNAGHMWRCHRCDVNGFNLVSAEAARERAEEHRRGEQHRRSSEVTDGR